MRGRDELSHVAPPRECDTRQTTTLSATGYATLHATSPGRPRSIRDLARDTLVRHRRDKEVARRATSLRQSIDRCCDARGDDDANRRALIEECLRLPFEVQADLAEHFEQEANRYATPSGNPPMTSTSQ